MYINNIKKKMILWFDESKKPLGKRDIILHIKGIQSSQNYRSNKANILTFLFC